MARPGFKLTWASRDRDIVANSGLVGAAAASPDGRCRWANRRRTGEQAVRPRIGAGAASMSPEFHGRVGVPRTPVRAAPAAAPVRPWHVYPAMKFRRLGRRARTDAALRTSGFPLPSGGLCFARKASRLSSSASPTRPPGSSCEAARQRNRPSAAQRPYRIDQWFTGARPH